MLNRIDDNELTFLGPGTQAIQTTGRYLMVRNASAPIYLKLDGSSEIEREAGETINLGPGNEMKRVQIRSTVPQTVQLTTSEYLQEDRRSILNATVTAVFEPSNLLVAPGDVVLGAGATLIAAGNVKRTGIEICLPSTAENPVRVGPLGVTASSGSIIEPGMSKVFSFEGAIYGIRTEAPDELVTVIEFERL